MPCTTLCRDLPYSGVTIVGFVNDYAIVVEKYPHDVTLTAKESVNTIRQWLSSAGLQLADHEMEAVLVTNRKVGETLTAVIVAFH